MIVHEYIYCIQNIVKTNAQSFEMETSKVKALYENELGRWI